MQTVKKKISELKPPERNVRLHGDRQIKEFIRSVEMFGQIRPLVVDENGVVLAGNGLLMALQKMDVKTADCYVIKGLSENQKKKLMLTDNKIFDLGTNSTEAFDAIIKELNGDIDIPGYDEELLKSLVASAAEADEMINDYGKLSDDRKASMMDAAEDAPEETTAAEEAEENTGENESGVPGAKLSFVICPKCGEKIFI